MNFNSSNDSLIEKLSAEDKVFCSLDFSVDDDNEYKENDTRLAFFSDSGIPKVLDYNNYHCHTPMGNNENLNESFDSSRNDNDDAYEGLSSLIVKFNKKSEELHEMRSQIYEIETEYLHKTQNSGNLVTGFNDFETFDPSAKLNPYYVSKMNPNLRVFTLADQGDWVKETEEISEEANEYSEQQMFDFPVLMNFDDNIKVTEEYCQDIVTLPQALKPNEPIVESTVNYTYFMPPIAESMPQTLRAIQPQIKRKNKTTNKTKKNHKAKKAVARFTKKHAADKRKVAANKRKMHNSSSKSRNVSKKQFKVNKKENHDPNVSINANNNINNNKGFMKPPYNPTQCFTFSKNQKYCQSNFDAFYSQAFPLLKCNPEYIEVEDSDVEVDSVNDNNNMTIAHDATTNLRTDTNETINTDQINLIKPINKYSDEIDVCI